MLVYTDIYSNSKTPNQKRQPVGSLFICQFSF